MCLSHELQLMTNQSRFSWTSSPLPRHAQGHKSARQGRFFLHRVLDGEDYDRGPDTGPAGKRLGYLGPQSWGRGLGRQSPRSERPARRLQEEGKGLRKAGPLLVELAMKGRGTVATWALVLLNHHVGRHQND